MNFKNKYTALIFASMSVFYACGDDSSSESSSNAPDTKTDLVSCYVYNVVDEENDEIDESCVEVEKGSSFEKSIKQMCDDINADIIDGAKDKAEYGDGCSTKNVLYTCDDENAKEKFTYIYYTIDEDRKALIVKGNDKATCKKLIEFEQQEIEDDPYDFEESDSNPDDE